MFERIGHGNRPLLADWSPPLSCVLTAAAVSALLLAVLPRRLTPDTAFVTAVGLTLATFAASVLAGRSAFATFQPVLRANPRAVVLCFAGFGLWFGPLFAGMSSDHPASILIAGVVAVGLARLCRRFERALSNREEDDAEALPTGMFQSLGQATASPHRAQTYLAAMLAQSAVVATTGERSLGAAMFAALACFLIGWLAQSTPNRTDFRLSRKLKIGLASSVLTAVAVNTLVLLLLNSRAGSAGIPGSAGKASRSVEGTHSGAILLAAPPRKTISIAPRERSRQFSFTEAADDDPISFPFSGEYWFFHWPQRRPSKNSMVSSDSPLVYTFTDVYHDPLVMWAWQPLNSPVSAACCSSIDMSVSNADRDPAAFSIELILVDNDPAAEKARTQSLGNQRLGLDEAPAKPVTEKLSFPLPARPAIREFDEIRIVFHLGVPRMHRSANVAIDRFYLVPRGSDR